jgi:hypothetical protein
MNVHAPSCAVLLLLVAAAAAAEIALPTAPTWRPAETDLYGTGLDIGDVDGDGWLDLAVSNGNDIVQAPNLVYLNDGGELPASASWVSDDHRYSGHCQLGDVDGDGDPELMVANYISPGWGVAQVQLYDNVGGVLATSPTWESPATFHSFRAAFGDPDGDGDLDLAVATGEAYHGNAEPNLIFFNEGGVLADTPGWISDAADTAYDVTFVDHDGDGDQDLAFLGGGPDGRPVIHENVGGVIGTSLAWTTSDPDNGNTFDFDDLDLDGEIDLLVGNNSQLGGSGRFAVYLSAGGVLPTSPTWVSDFSGYGSAVVCADLDGRNGPDLVTGGWWEVVRVYLNRGLGVFAGEPDWTTDSAWASVVENIALADLDDAATRTHTAVFAGGVSHYELPHRHLQAVTRVEVDGIALPPTETCHSLRDGWVSVGAAGLAAAEVRVLYAASPALDLAFSNWDDAIYVFENPDVTAAPAVAVTGPASISRLRAWPNPFNPSTEIGFVLDRSAPRVQVRVFDARGREVARPFRGALAAGAHTVPWRPDDLPSGVYLYRVEAGDAVATGKAILAR